MFKLIIEKIKRKSHKKKQKSETLGPKTDNQANSIAESELSEADEEAIRVQLWRDAQESFQFDFFTFNVSLAFKALNWFVNGF